MNKMMISWSPPGPRLDKSTTAATAAASHGAAVLCGRVITAAVAVAAVAAIRYIVRRNLDSLLCTACFCQTTKSQAKINFPASVTAGHALFSTHPLPEAAAAAAACSGSMQQAASSKQQAA